ncbi:MAG: radical SAM protein [Candidatus Sulfobium sp.]
MKLTDIAFLKTPKNPEILKTHPCFSEEAHHRFGRIHLPVAPSCNIQCRYCIRKYDCANESRPGITSKVLNPSEALERVRAVVDRNDNISVIGIAGPGDPLANDETFEVMSMVHREFPDLTLCVSTNGLALPERIEALMRSGVRSITVTINAATPAVAEKIYSWVSYHGKKYTGIEAARRIVANQWRGLTNAIDAGFIVKVNTVLIPGINDVEIPLEFSHLQRPSREVLAKKRAGCSPRIPQMTHCRQCRADACGVLGEDKDMELELLNARIGEEYCDAVY